MKSAALGLIFAATIYGALASAVYVSLWLMPGVLIGGGVVEGMLIDRWTRA